VHEENRVKLYRLNKHQLINERLKYYIYTVGARNYRYFSVNSQWTSSVVITYAVEDF